jgi:hypothetical protein
MSSSLKERIAERHRRVHENRTFDLPVPGYADMLGARYRPLPIEKTLEIYLRYQSGSLAPETEVDANDIVAAAADMLVNACEELLEKNGDGSYHGMSTRWTTAAIADLFPLGEETDSVRDALMAAITTDGVMEHFNAYALEAAKVRKDLDGAVEGESAAATAATSSNSRPELDLPESK